MKETSGFLLIAAFVLNSTLVLGQSDISLETVIWLEGTWKRLNMNNDQIAFEIWSKREDGSLQGIGYTMRGVDTTFIEKLQIVEKDDTLFYVADVSHNVAPVYFEFKAASGSGFRCENPSHDFPQKIVYSLSGSDLAVVISAGEKVVEFEFERVRE